MTTPDQMLSPPPAAVARCLSAIPQNAYGDARRAQRREYPFQQRYALYREGRWPSAEEFRTAELCDISPQGLALHVETRPAAEMLVVELGVGANVSRVLVKIVQVAPISAAGEKRFRIGCEFISLPPRD